MSTTWSTAAGAIVLDMQIQIDQARLTSELQTLATFTDAEPVSDGTSVTRVVF
jgi:hypothetical protein